MVIGIPNVGKSSLINALRRQHLRKGMAFVLCGLSPGVQPLFLGPQTDFRTRSLPAPRGCLCTERTRLSA